MVNQDLSDEELRRIRRLHKFSSEARDKIVNDPLNDRALLSRSTSSVLNELRDSPKLRNKLLNDLQDLWKGSDPGKDTQVEHGLRKLREIIVSIYNQHDQDKEFIQFTLDVYKLSYDYYHSKKEYHKLGNLVLAFVVTNLPKPLAAEYAEIYALFISHIECNMGNCLKFVNKWQPFEGGLNISYKRSVRMSMIFNNRTESPVKWLQLLEEIPSDSMAYKFLRDSPAFVEMRDRCFTAVSRCYNQISFHFLQQYWLHNMMSESDLRAHFKTTINPHGTEIVEFKRPRR